MNDDRGMTPAALTALLNGDLANFEAASTPDGIEAQEKAGQTELVASTKMPIELNPDTAAFQALGFKFGKPIDELFQEAKLPKGWTRRATDHDMWSEILDADGAVRVQVFYKAAFYDQKAHASLTKTE